MIEKMFGMLLQSPQMQQTMGQMMQMVQQYDAAMKELVATARRLEAKIDALRADLEEPEISGPETPLMLEATPTKEIENV